MSELQTLDPNSEATCITEHPGFSGACLDMWVLSTTAHQIRHTHGQGAIARTGPSHKYVTSCSRPLQDSVNYILLCHTTHCIAATSHIDS